MHGTSALVLSGTTIIAGGIAGSTLIAADVSMGPVEGGVVAVITTALVGVIMWLLRYVAERDKQWIASQKDMATTMSSLQRSVDKSAIVSEAGMRVLASAKGLDPTSVDEIVKSVIERTRGRD